jgi:hypothetical protein
MGIGPYAAVVMLEGQELPYEDMLVILYLRWFRATARF